MGSILTSIDEECKKGPRTLSNEPTMHIVGWMVMEIFKGLMDGLKIIMVFYEIFLLKSKEG